MFSEVHIVIVLSILAQPVIFLFYTAFEMDILFGISYTDAAHL